VSKCLNRPNVAKPPITLFFSRVKNHPCTDAHCNLGANVHAHEIIQSHMYPPSPRPLLRDASVGVAIQPPISPTRVGARRSTPYCTIEIGFSIIFYTVHACEHFARERQGRRRDPPANLSHARRRASVHVATRTRHNIFYTVRARERFARERRGRLSIADLTFFL